MRSASHQRDLEQLMPWAQLLCARRAAQSSRRRWRGSASSASIDPDARRSAGPLRGGARHPARSRAETRRAATQATTRARVDALIDALERSAGAARALERRLVALAELARRAVRRRWSSASCSIPARQLLSIGYQVAEGTLDPKLLRPARLRGAPGELRRDRQGRRAGAALVPARARPDAGRPRLGADLVVGIDVRVPDAVAGDARAGRAACSSRPAASSSAGRSSTAPSSACPGASRNRRTTRAISSSPISTRTSACPAWASSAASARTPSSRPTRRRWRRWWIRRPRRGTSRAWPRPAAAAATAATRRSTTRRRASRRASRSRSSAPTWRTTRG